MSDTTDKDFRCGFVAVVGRPNTGKSTLVNTILNKKIAIVTKIPQTTRHAIRGILNDKNAQIIFVDTPGIHLSKDRMGRIMNKTSRQMIEDVDVVVHLMDMQRSPGKEEAMIVDTLKTLKKPIILGLNKIDLGDKFIQEYLDLWQKAKQKTIAELFDTIRVVPLSGLKRIHIQELIDTLIEFLPESVPLFPTDVVSDFPQRLLLAEIVREKLLHRLKEEIPYGLSVSVEEIIEQRRKCVTIQMTVYVIRDSQKKIVIGHKGDMLKHAGTDARKELEQLLGKRVYLDLIVKTKRDWREDRNILKELGYLE
ncbi:GTPase Era [Candidatus Omnitrophota bacterium]